MIFKSEDGFSSFLATPSSEDTGEIPQEMIKMKNKNEKQNLIPLDSFMSICSEKARKGSKGNDRREKERERVGAMFLASREAEQTHFGFERFLR